MFSPKGAGQPEDGVIKRISPIRAARLEYPQLASIYGGSLAVVEEPHHEYRLLDSYFPVLIELERQPILRIGQEGVVTIRGPWNSYLVRLLKTLATVFWQEGNA